MYWFGPLFEACNDFAVYTKQGHSYRVISGEMGEQVQDLQHQTWVYLFCVLLFLRLSGLQLPNFDNIMPESIAKPFRSKMQQQDKVRNQPLEVVSINADGFDQGIGVLGVFYVVGEEEDRKDALKVDFLELVELAVVFSVLV